MTATLHVLPTHARSAPPSENVTTTDPAVIVRDLVRLAQRHDLPLPEDDALELDTDIIATWPAGLWTKAFLHIWATWRYRRMPTVGDFRAIIAADLDAVQPDTSAQSSPPDTAKPAGPTKRPALQMRLTTLEDCIAAVKDAGQGMRQTWWNRAKRTDPTLLSGDVTNLQRWVPLVAPRIMTDGLYAPD